MIFLNNQYSRDEFVMVPEAKLVPHNLLQHRTNLEHRPSKNGARHELDKCSVDNARDYIACSLSPRSMTHFI